MTIHWRSLVLVTITTLGLAHLAQLLIGANFWVGVFIGYFVPSVWVLWWPYFE